MVIRFEKTVCLDKPYTGRVLTFEGGDPDVFKEWAGGHRFDLPLFSFNDPGAAALIAQDYRNTNKDPFLVSAVHVESGPPTLFGFWLKNWRSEMDFPPGTSTLLRPLGEVLLQELRRVSR